jgi:hypothetical protein
MSSEDGDDDGEWRLAIALISPAITGDSLPAL